MLLCNNLVYHLLHWFVLFVDHYARMWFLCVTLLHCLLGRLGNPKGVHVSNSGWHHAALPLAAAHSLQESACEGGKTHKHVLVQSVCLMLLFM